MAEVLAFLLVAGGLGAILGGFVWLAARIRRGGGTIMGPIDEIYNPAAHRARLDIQIQSERAVPTASPDDQHKPVR